MTFALTLAALLSFLMIGAFLGAVMDVLVPSWIARRPIAGALSHPVRSAAALLAQQRITTEAPDRLNWLLAPAWYITLAAAGLSVVPFDEGVVLVELSTGVVLWGAVESLTVVVVFLHGWSPNSPFPLIGAYRYVAIGLPIMLLSMFVLIAAAIPANSLDIMAIVESQRELWNVIRQPLGLPLFLLLGLSLTLRGPFDYADSADLEGGTSVEDSGAARASWQLARLFMLVSFSAMAATAFLGGYLGPVLPGPVWLALKTLMILAIIVALTHLFARMPPSRMMGFLWKVLLPIAFVGLLQAGLQAL